MQTLISHPPTCPQPGANFSQLRTNSVTVPSPRKLKSCQVAPPAINPPRNPPHTFSRRLHEMTRFLYWRPLIGETGAARWTAFACARSPLPPCPPFSPVHQIVAMTIRYKCETCGSVLKIKDALAGTDGRCPKCKTEFVVPQPEDADPETAAAAAATTDGPEDDADDDAQFDPVAFLMDDGGKPTKGAASPSPSTPAAAGAGAAAGKKPVVRKRAPAEPDADGEASKPVVRRRASVDTDFDEDEPPPPPRKSQSARTDAASAAQTADAMLRINASSNAKDLLTKTMEESRVRAAQMPEDRTEPGIDWKAEFKDLLFRFGPAAGGAVVLVVLTYWFANYMAGGGLELPDLGRVRGVVTKGGDPLAGAQVMFEPMDVKASTATAITRDDGSYDLIYTEGVYGAVVGKNRVWVTLIGPDGKEQVPARTKYGYGGTDVETVKKGSNKIDIPIP